MKKCSKCSKNKKESCFYIDKRTGSLRSYCKDCGNAMNREWRFKNKEKVKNQNKKHQTTFKLKHIYKIDSEELYSLIEKSNNMCMICSKEEKLYIDHNHDTNKVRGLLCSKCNLGLGHFNDDIKILLQAIDYLQNK